MSSMISVRAFAASVAFGACAFLLSCSGGDGVNVSGGVSEETNTVAGILTDVNGSPVSGAVMLARHVQMDTVEFIDTTSEKGEFAFPITRHGTYGLSTVKDSLAYYETFVYEGKSVEIKAKLQKAGNVSASVQYSDEFAASVEGVEVIIPGSAWSVTADSTGAFTFAKVPQGRYKVQVEARGSYADAAYLLSKTDSSYAFYGPYPSDYEFDSLAVASTESDSAVAHVLALPLSLDQGLRSWWSMDFTTVSDGDTITTDARNYTGSTRLYGDVELATGVIGKSLHFANASSYGVIENDNGLMDSLTEFTLEAFVKFNALESGAYQKNIVGKLGFGNIGDKDVFSLALVDSACGAAAPRLSMFVSDGSGTELSCENAAVSTKPIEAGEWIYVVATLKNGTLNIYQNAELVGTAETNVQMFFPSEEPIFFGKENLNVNLDDVRLETRAIASADVFYRFYQKTGGEL